MEYRHIIKDPYTSATWMQSAENDILKLMEALKRGITGTQMMKIVHRSNIPEVRKVTYARFVCNYRSQKEEADRCQLIVGRDRLEYLGDVSTKTADLTTIKCILNSMLSKLTVRFMTADVRNFYLNTPLYIP